jgi:hypothetical protein
MKKYLITITLYLCCLRLAAQNTAVKETSFPATDISILQVSVAWGNIKIQQSGSTNTVKVLASYTNFEKKNLEAGVSRLLTRKEGGVLLISSPVPPDGKFESYDVTVQVPVTMNLVLKIERGGDIAVQGIAGSIEIDNQNGSTKVDGVSNWLTVNNFNGEISVSYAELKNVAAISLITFNGGITLFMPTSTDADITLRTKKNGSISSDFPVRATTGSLYKNTPPGQFTNNVNQWNGTIGKGGTKIIAITNNGPVDLKTANSLTSAH